MKHSVRSLTYRNNYELEEKLDSITEDECLEVIGIPIIEYNDYWQNYTATVILREVRVI